MLEKYRKCNDSCPGYSTHKGGWCGYAGNWGEQVKPGDICHLGYSLIPAHPAPRQSKPSNLEQTARKEMPNPVKGLKLTLFPIIREH